MFFIRKFTICYKKRRVEGVCCKGVFYLLQGGAWKVFVVKEILICYKTRLGAWKVCFVREFPHLLQAVREGVFLSSKGSFLSLTWRDRGDIEGVCCKAICISSVTLSEGLTELVQV